MLSEGRAGVFPLCVILLFVKREFRKLFFVTRDLKICVTREEPELLTVIHDFTTQFCDFGTQVLGIVRVVDRE